MTILSGGEAKKVLEEVRKLSNEELTDKAEFADELWGKQEGIIMIKIITKSNQSALSEEHLYPIMFALQDSLEIYRQKLQDLNSIPYNSLDGEETYLIKWYQNKIADTEKVLNEINSAIDNIRD